MTVIHSTVDKSKKKGWFLGPWNSKVPIPVGYANQAVRERHYHQSHGRNPLKPLAIDLKQVSGETDSPRLVTWALSLRLGRKESPWT